jgi:hypothetical protein
MTGQSFAGAIEFFETKRDGLISTDAFFSSLSLYCLNGDVYKVEALAQVADCSLRKGALADWLWGSYFGFEPPK